MHTLHCIVSSDKKLACNRNHRFSDEIDRESPKRVSLVHPPIIDFLAYTISQNPCFGSKKVIPEIKDLVKDLRARGWRVVIVTASPTWIVEPGARRLGLGPEDVLGIEVCTYVARCWASKYFFWTVPAVSGKAVNSPCLCVCV